MIRELLKLLLFTAFICASFTIIFATYADAIGHPIF